MSAARGRVLFVDDERAMRDMVEKALARRDFAVTAVADVPAALAALREAAFDVVVTDLNLRGADGLQLAHEAAANFPDVPVLLLTAFGSLPAAVDAIRAGAYDFLTKPVDIDALALALDRAVTFCRLRAEVGRLRERLGEPTVGELLGDSASMRRLRQVIAKVGPADANVLITGETGAGKELVARALHAASPRASGPFVAVNCAAIGAGVLESELFGHVRGAFTDAHRDRRGLFEQANGGTLFLDEVGELDLALQPKLLRALQDGVVRPVGSEHEIAVDVRVLAATNRDLVEAVERGQFRSDLYYRLDVVGVAVPPLRERGGDVLLLAQGFARAAAARCGKAVAGLTEDTARLLLAYPWPGNVRELENAIESAVALTAYERLIPGDLPAKVRDHTPAHVVVAAPDMTGLATLAEVELRYIRHVLAVCGGNRTNAARILGLDRKTLYRRLHTEGDARDA